MLGTNAALDSVSTSLHV